VKKELERARKWLQSNFTYVYLLIFRELNKLHLGYSIPSQGCAPRKQNVTQPQHSMIIFSSPTFAI
jgi:hypothetical protein